MGPSTPGGVASTSEVRKFAWELPVAVWKQFRKRQLYAHYDPTNSEVPFQTNSVSGACFLQLQQNVPE